MSGPKGEGVLGPGGCESGTAFVEGEVVEAKVSPSKLWHPAVASNATRASKDKAVRVVIMDEKVMSTMEDVK